MQRPRDLNLKRNYTGLLRANPWRFSCFCCWGSVVTGAHSPWALPRRAAFHPLLFPVRPSRNRDPRLPTFAVRPSLLPSSSRIEFFSSSLRFSHTRFLCLPHPPTHSPLPAWQLDRCPFFLDASDFGRPDVFLQTHLHHHTRTCTRCRACVARQPPPPSSSRSPPWVVPSFAPSSTTCRPAACIHHTHHLLPSPRRQVRPCLPQHRSRTCAAYTYGNRPRPAPLSPGATRPKSSFPGPTLFATTTNSLLQFST